VIARSDPALRARALLSVLVIISLACGDGGGPSDGPAEWIAFQSHRTFNNDVWVMRPDGSGLRNVTNDPADDIEPAISPDGGRIAFISDRGGSYELYVINFDGTNATPLTDDIGIIGWPAWTPDGLRIAYERGQDIRMVNAAGGGDTLLIAGGRRPAWSPDGNSIAFGLAGQPTTAIYIADRDGGNAQVVDSTDDGGDPAWSPDGTRLAFAIFGEIYVIGVAGTGRQQLTNRARPDFQPSWSPDGTSLIFTCDLATIVGDLNYEVCRIPAGGGVAVNLTRLAAPDMRATWFRE
jgi:TolB protein